MMPWRMSQGRIRFHRLAENKVSFILILVTYIYHVVTYVHILHENQGLIG